MNQFRNQKKKDKSTSKNLVDMLQEDSTFPVICRPLATQYVVVVDEEFYDTQQFEDAVDVLHSASESDIVIIELTTCGGSLQSIIPMISAMKTTKAQTHVQCISDVASAGTFLMMLADTCYVNEYATIMLHNVQFGAVGTGSSVASLVEHTTRTSESLIRDIYAGFLTDLEINMLLQGKDFYFTPDECHSRFKLREQVQALQQ